jgi:soluble lytic murein transglycosylase-like protein
MSRILFVALPILCGMPQWAHACWDEVAQRHGIPANLLYAIAQVESGLNPNVVNRSHFKHTGSIDIGLMQINSRNLPELAKRGITQASLFDPCTNLDVGAGLLAELFSRRGLSWDSVGAYNAACTELKGDDCLKARARYAWKVYEHLPSNSRARRAPAAIPRSSARAAAPAAPLLLAVRVSP